MKRQVMMLAVGIVALGMLWACTNKTDEVRQFVADFSTAIQQGDKDAIAKAYPAAAEADSLNVLNDAEALAIEPSEDGKAFVVKSGDITMTVTHNDDGTMQVTQSQGLFAYPADRLDFAKKTGQYKPSLNDAENAQRMADTLFTTWMQVKIDKKKNSLVEITNSSVSKKHISDQWTGTENDLCCYTVTVANNTAHVIGSNDYTISVKELWDDWNDGWEDGSFEETRHPKSASKTLTGKPIPANGTVNYAWERTFEGAHHRGSTNYRIQSTLNYTPSQSSDLLYDFKGNEYEEYLKNQ